MSATCAAVSWPAPIVDAEALPDQGEGEQQQDQADRLPVFGCEDSITAAVTAPSSSATSAAWKAGS